MTPETAQEMGKRLTESAVLEMFAFDGDRETFLDEMQDAVAGDSESGELPDELTTFALRGSAAFFREVADELDARAAALEATR